MNVYFEWVGSICGILGALLISSNTRISPWGYPNFVAMPCAEVVVSARFALFAGNGKDSFLLLFCSHPVAERDVDLFSVTVIDVVITGKKVSRR